MYVSHGWHYSIHLNLCYKEEFLGILSFFRQKGKENFSYDHVQVLDMIKDHLAYRMDRERVRKPSIEHMPGYTTLSKREREIVHALLTRKTPEELADDLSISINTLNKHISHIYHKLGIRGRMQLLDYAE